MGRVTASEEKPQKPMQPTLFLPSLPSNLEHANPQDAASSIAIPLIHSITSQNETIDYSVNPMLQDEQIETIPLLVVCWQGHVHTVQSEKLSRIRNKHNNAKENQTEDSRSRDVHSPHKPERFHPRVTLRVTPRATLPSTMRFRPTTIESAFSSSSPDVAHPSPLESESTSAATTGVANSP